MKAIYVYSCRCICYPDRHTNNIQYTIRCQTRRLLRHVSEIDDVFFEPKRWCYKWIWHVHRYTRTHTHTCGHVSSLCLCLKKIVHPHVHAHTEHLVESNRWITDAVSYFQRGTPNGVCLWIFHVHMHLYITYSRVHTHTHARTYAYTHTHTLTHTHTHTHTRIVFCPWILLQNGMSV